MLVREPAVAGMFYPDHEAACRSELDDVLGGATSLPAVGGQILGGIVPHAGWICSGAVAGKVFAALRKDPPETVVLLGAVHYPIGPAAAMFGGGAWRTPIGSVAIDAELAEAVLDRCELVLHDPEAHRAEHSIEVQVPFIRRLLPQARLLPIMVPPGDNCPKVGEEVAEAVRQLGRKVAYVGSTDLTHYGPRYRFTPQGLGRRGVAWAKQVNDRRMLDLILAMRAEEVVEEAQAHLNACGSGAVSATIAACRRSGAERAVLLEHTNSAETLAHIEPGEPSDAVGYAAVVFTRGDSPPQPQA